MCNKRSGWVVLLTACLANLPVNALATEPPDFTRDVAPILEEHCVRCHNPGNAKGEFSVATASSVLGSGHLTVGEPESSYLIDLIVASDGERPAMPKEGDPLAPDDVETLRQWIAAGANWPENIVLRERSKADASWWSFQPLKDSQPPSLTPLQVEWSSNLIDRFIFAKLAENGLAPNPPADRRTLVRRLTYDLTGFPPTPEEIEHFISDHRHDAYERLVDRLLASPHHGERWGRHWLDVVRFGESNGFERNVLINNVWPFRDYVIDSFNNDKPFDHLVREHLAGDVIAEGNPDVAVGTAFLVCGPYDNVGNQDAAQAAIIRADALDEMIRTTGEAFLGLTIGCARCHDHKFDPITQQDYYGLYATFAGVKHGERDIGRGPWWVGNFEPAEGPFHVFTGGDPQRKGAEAVPASLEALEDVPSHFELTSETPESQRRLQLAQWIVSPDNPLTARVLANRLWQHHFGTGIVETPSDFGFMGGAPSHPKLLDRLAQRLLADGWRMKPLHRLIVTSQAYRQSGDYRAEAASVDAASRLLWRFPPRRLAGEEVRDTMLAAAGKLDNRMGGPGFRLYEYVEDNVATYIPLNEYGPETYRRAVYHQNARAASVDLLTDFDCPDPAFAAPRRPTTTTPLQALAMMNHNFPLDMAEALAERVEKEAGEETASRIRFAFLLTFGRQPVSEELVGAQELTKAHGLRAVCRVLLNSNEMVTVR